MQNRTNRQHNWLDMATIKYCRSVSFLYWNILPQDKPTMESTEESPEYFIYAFRKYYRLGCSDKEDVFMSNSDSSHAGNIISALG